MALSMRARWALVIGDVVAVLAFLLGGQTQHSTVNAGNPLLGLLVLGAYYVPVWLLVAWLLDAYPPAALPLRDFLGRSLNAWLVAAPLATIVRSFGVGTAVIPVPFLLVTLGVGGAIVIGWRLLYGAVVLRGAK